MKQICYFYLIAFFLFSCASPKEQKLDLTETFSFEVIDSLDLRIIGNPMLINVSPKANRLVFYDYPSREFVFTDASGTVISKFSKKADTPDAYGFLLEFPGFIDDEKVALAGMNGVFIYDLEGTMIKKMAHPESLGGAGSMSFIGKGIETITLSGKPYILSKSVRTRDTYAGEQKFYDTFKALELIDIENANSLEIVPFEEGSQFLDGNGYFESDYAPALEAFGDKLYVALGGERRLLVYSLKPDGAKLDTIVNLQIPGFEKLPVTSREEFYKGSITIKGSTPAIRNIHIIDGKIILHYYGGIPEPIMKEADAFWEAGNEEESERLYEKASKEVVQGALILDIQTLKPIGNIQLPIGVSQSGFASGGGYLWMEKAPNEEEEEDFLRIYKMKLVDK